MGDLNIRTTQNSWVDFANTLTNDFKSQFGAQSAVFQQLTSKFTDMLKNPRGFSPEALSALRGGAVQQIATQFNNARQAVGATEAARGDFNSDVKSGVKSQIQGQIAGQEASATAGGLDEIEKANEEQKINNQNIALSGLSGVASMENPNGLAGEATGAAKTVSDLGLANQEIAASQYQNSFGGAFGSSFAKGLGSTLSGANAGKGNSDSSIGNFLGF